MLCAMHFGITPDSRKAGTADSKPQSVNSVSSVTRAELLYVAVRKIARP
jgi:hypothetical protein